MNEFFGDFEDSNYGWWVWVVTIAVIIYGILFVTVVSQQDPDAGCKQYRDWKTADIPAKCLYYYD